MENLLKLLKFLLLIGLFSVSVNAIFAVPKVNSQSLEKVEKAIVTIDSRIAMSAYHDTGSCFGSGFVADKANGFIVTNAHVIGTAAIGTYFVTFHNGQQVQAKPIYYDLWQDYAILKIIPEEIPATVEQILFSKTMAKMGENVFVIGSPEGREFSFHSGYISTLYEITGIMPQTSYVINLNSAGGASGSPLLNEKNEAIGVVYGGGRTYAFALHAGYVQKTLDSLRTNKIPTRKHIGILCELYSLDRAVRHRHFPKNEMEEYIKRFPDARNKVVAVRSIIPNSPAENLLKPGDIIWEVNGIALGGNLAILDNAMDNTVEHKVTLTTYRNGKKLEQIVDLYDINENKVQQMVNFAGAVFFEADDIVSAKTGIPLKALAIKNVQTGSSFSSIPVSFTHDYKNIYRLVITAINEQNINNLDELIKIIPSSIEQQFISVRFKNYQPYYPSFELPDGSFVSSQDYLIADITFDSIDTKPRILKHDPATQDWLSVDIDPQGEGQ